MSFCTIQNERTNFQKPYYLFVTSPLSLRKKRDRCRMNFRTIGILVITFLLFSNPILVTASFQPNEDVILADPPQTIVYVDPQNVTASVGEDFTIKVKVANVTGLYAIDIQFSYDPTLLDYVNRTVKIPVDGSPAHPDGILYKPGIKIKDIVDAAAGTYWLSYVSLGTAPVFNGTGIAFEMSFTVLREAACYLHFTSTLLSGKGAPPPSIAHEVRDGNFWSTLSPSFAPIADFTFSPDKAFVGRTLVTINASTSFDPDGGNLSYYAWDFGDGTSDFTVDPIITHTFETTGCDVALTVGDDEDSVSVPLTKHIGVTIYRDISITRVQVPPQMLRGKEVIINVTVGNLGDQDETSFRIDTYYNETAVDPTNITATTWVEIEGKTIAATVGPAEEYNETFSWDTGDVTAEVYYYIMANASLQVAWNDVNLTNNVRLSSNSIYITSPPVASFINIPTRPLVNETVTFDASASFDSDGNITLYEWNFGDGATATYIEGVNLTDITTHAYTSIGNYLVTLTVTDNDGLTNSSTKYVQAVEVVTYLDIDIDVGTIHFGGEKVEFYILVTRLGERVNVSEATAILYFNGSNFTDLTSKLETITTGFYRITYTLSSTASSGTYTLHVEASYFNLKGNAIKSFLVSQTLDGWDFLIADIKDEIATIIIPNLGQIKLDLTEINATLVGIDNTVGIINSTVGRIETDLSLINATITDIIVDSKGELLAKIDYYLGADGTITVKLADLNATLTGIIVNSEGEIVAEITTVLEKFVITKLNALNATVTSIEGNVITVTTELGSLRTTTSDVQTTATNSLYAIAIVSVLATAFFLALLLILRKKPSA